MKSFRLIVFFVFLSIFTISCGKTEEFSVADEVISNPTATREATLEENEVALVPSLVEQKDPNVDVDLTVLSSTMVFSQVYDMLYSPERYAGKTIKMEGTFAVYEDADTGNTYYACVIMDATACCAQGLEFVLEDANAYPPENAQITVIGEYETYEDGGYTFSRLSHAKLF